MKVARTRVRSQSLPRGQCSPRRFYRRVNVGRRSLSHCRELLASRRIRRVEISSCRWRLPRAVDEVPEAATVAVEPCKSLARIFGRWAVLHGHEFFDNAHSLLLASLTIEP